MTPPRHKLPNIELIAIANTGTQISILPENKATAFGIELFKVATKVKGKSIEPWLDIKGGTFLEISNPLNTQSPKTVRLFYVARNVDRCYLSVTCIKAL